MIFLLYHAPIVIPSAFPSGLFMPAEKFYTCFMETFGNIFNNCLENQHFMFCSVSEFPETGIKMEHLSRLGGDWGNILFRYLNKNRHESL